MERELMRRQMESVRSELNRVDADREVLEGLLKAHESWFRIHPENGANPPTTPPQLPLEGISFKEGLLAVLRQSRGEPLHVKEIWHRMREMGVSSNAKRPEGFVSMHANKMDEVEKVEAATFRLKID